MTTTCTSNYTKLLNTLEELNMPALRANISTYMSCLKRKLKKKRSVRHCMRSRQQDFHLKKG